MPPDPKDDQAPAGDRDKVLRELEAAWEGWVRGNPPADARTSSMLRAAFAAGFEAAHGDAGTTD
jgi:hypothetical protein